MTDAGASARTTAEAREQFTQLVAELRPELHRYCARMTGSVFDGEDVVQETLARAHQAMADMAELPALRPWIFRIAHNAALDVHKRYERRHVDLVPEVPERMAEEEVAVDPELVEAALAVFVVLPPLQRSVLILKDVLGHSLEEVANTLGTSVGATKAALSRARAGLGRAASVAHPTSSAESRATPEEHALLQRYVDLFNARDWEGLRALLGQEAELDLVSRLRKKVVDAGYYHRYAEILQREDLRAEAGLADNAPTIAMYRPTSATPAYFVQIAWVDGQVAKIRDFYHVPYIALGARFSPRRP